MDVNSKFVLRFAKDIKILQIKLLTMMLMGCFYGMVDLRAARSCISERDHRQKASPS